jgi:hypothetical protein
MKHCGFPCLLDATHGTIWLLLLDFTIIFCYNNIVNKADLFIWCIILADTTLYLDFV